MCDQISEAMTELDFCVCVKCHQVSLLVVEQKSNGNSINRNLLSAQLSCKILINTITAYVVDFICCE